MPRMRERTVPYGQLFEFVKQSDEVGAAASPQAGSGCVAPGRHISALLTNSLI
jgi:hypothetical protein